MLEEQLKKFGLSEKEAKTYITLLVLGESTANAVAEESGVNRSSAYVVLEALQKKGLAKASDGSGVQKFRAAPPEMLAEIAEERLREHKNIAKNVRQILPELRGVQSDNKFRPKIHIYEGAEGIMELFNATYMIQEKEMRVASSVSQFSKMLPKSFFPNYIKQRIKKGIRMIGIHPKTRFTQIVRQIAPETINETTLIPKERYTFEADIAIFDDSIAYMTHQNGGYGIKIDDPTMAQSMKVLFDMAKKEAGRLEKTK